MLQFHTGQNWSDTADQVMMTELENCEHWHEEEQVELGRKDPESHAELELDQSKQTGVIVSSGLVVIVGVRYGLQLSGWDYLTHCLWGVAGVLVHKLHRTRDFSSSSQ